MSFENILKLLETLPSEQADLKTQLLDLVKGLNQEKGKASADIIKIKKELDSLKGDAESMQKEKATYQEITKELTKLGIDAKNADQLLEKLNIKKSVEDENATLKNLLKEREDKLKLFETQQQMAERKEKVTPLFEKALGEFVEAKRKEGNPNYLLTDNFVNKEALYKEIDIDNDTLRNDHFIKVLQDADQKQQSFMESTGMDYVKPVHRQGSNEGHYSGRQGINTVASEAIVRVRDSAGSNESVVAGIAQLHAAQENNS